MLTTLRRLSKSKGGQFIFVILLLTMLAAWGLADVTSLRTGDWGIGGGGLANVGSESVSQADMDKIMERRLAQLRQQKPDATYATIAPEFDSFLTQLLQERTLMALADKAGLTVSKRLVDAEIAQIPGMLGFDGKFSEANYQQFLARERLTDQIVRGEIRSSILQRLVLLPAAATVRVPVGQALPYASMMMEARSGEIGFVATKAFEAGIQPTPADFQSFYAANRARYAVPEQRVLRIARIGPDQVAAITASDAEIAAAYKAGQAQYAAKDSRVINRAVVAGKAQADAIAAKVRAGTAFAAAAAPAGLATSDVSLGAQTQAQLANLISPAIADAAFKAPAGGVVGPVQSDLGWVVLKVESVKHEAGKSLDQARPEIAAKLTADKRKTALDELVSTVEDEVSERANFTETVTRHKLSASETPPLLADGSSRAQPGYKLPAELQPILKEGFSLEPDDEPTIVTLANNAGYALVALGQVTPAAPAPLAAVADRVRADFVHQRALEKARVLAQSLAAKANGPAALGPLIAGAGVALPKPAPVNARRLQIAQYQGNVPAPLKMLFALAAGKAQYVAAPNGEGFFLVKVNSITPGDARTNPGIIAQQQAALNQQAGPEIAEQFVKAVQRQLGVKRNESAIAQAKQRLASAQ